MAKLQEGTRVLCYGREPGIIVKFNTDYSSYGTPCYDVLLDDGTKILVAHTSLTTEE